MASIEKRVLPSGRTRWLVRYRTPEGTQASQTFDRKVDAENWSAQNEVSKLDGTFVDRRRAAVTVGAWSGEWLKGKLNLAATTKARYEDILKVHIMPRWGTVRLSDVRHEDVQAWLSDLKLGAASVRKTHRVLSMVLGYAVKSGRLAVNPAAGVNLPRVRARQMRFLSDVQVDVLAREVGEAWRLPVLFMAYTGVRVGELAALKVVNLDLLHRRATIRESYSSVRGVMVLSDTKTHKPRQVPIPKFLVHDLNEQISGKGKDDLVFTGPRGAILRPQTLLQTAFPKASKVLGLSPPLHPHELRHTAVSLAIQAGGDPKVIQQIAGHATAAMTLDVYGHLMPDQLDAVADKMEKNREKALRKAKKAAAGVVSIG